MENIIKVNHLEKDKVKKIYVFSGDFNVTLIILILQTTLNLFLLM